MDIVSYLSDRMDGTNLFSIGRGRQNRHFGTKKDFLGLPVCGFM